MTKQKNEVAVIGDASAALANVGDLSMFSGSLQVRQSLISIPQLKLVQKMSQAADSRLAMPGEFACDKKMKNYGPSVEIIPLFISESASLLFNVQTPLNKVPSGMDVKSFKDGQVLCTTKDLIHGTVGNCASCPFGSNHEAWVDGKAPKCRSSIDVICIVRNDIDAGPVNFSFRKSNHKAGKAILNLVIYDELYRTKNVMFGSSYLLSSIETPRPDAPTQKYHKINEFVKPSKLSNEEILKILPIAISIAESRKKNAIEVEIDEEVPV